MNQPIKIDTDLESKNIPPNSLEGRMNALVQKLSNSNEILLENIEDEAKKIAQSFPLNLDEIKVGIPYVMSQIIKGIVEEMNENDKIERHAFYPRAFLHIAYYMLLVMIAYEKHGAPEILLGQYEYGIDPESANIVNASVCALSLQMLYQGNMDYIRAKVSNLKRLHSGLLDGSNALTEEFFGLSLELYSVDSQYRSVKHWVECISHAEEDEKRRLLHVPFVWSEAEFKKQSRPSSFANHIIVGDRSYKIDDFVKKVLGKNKAILSQFYDGNEKITWYVQILLDERGKIVFQYILSTGEDRLNTVALNSSKITKTKSEQMLHALQNVTKVETASKILFSHIDEIKAPIFHEQGIKKILEDLRGFDVQQSSSSKTKPITENVAHDVISLTNKTFIDPKQHHTDVAQSLGLDIIDHSDDVGIAEAIKPNHLRYKNQNGESNLHYLPKIAWLIDILEDIIPRNEHGKITAYTLPSSPYVFIYTNTGTIFISDIDNVSTQVFAQKVDSSFINSEFSFPKLGGLFGPLTSIKNNFEEIISDEEAESWTRNIVDALNKKDGYFPDLMSDGQPRWGINLRTLYHSGEMTKKNFATPIALKQFLENYNKTLLLRSDITIKQKQDLSVVNSRGGVPNTQPLINALGGHSFFTSYHGHAPFFSEYFDALLSNNAEYKDTLYDRLRSKNKVKASVKNWINELKNGVRTISDNQFHRLFSTDTHVKKSMRKELDVPFGLLTSASWIIALGYDPEQCIQGETPEACLHRILIQENIIPRTI